MQLPGNRIPATLPGADGCGSPRTIRLFDPPPQETRSHSPSLDDFFRRENGGRNLKGVYFEQLQEVATARQLDYTIPGLA